MYITHIMPGSYSYSVEVEAQLEVEADVEAHGDVEMTIEVNEVSELDGGVAVDFHVYLLLT